MSTIIIKNGQLVNEGTISIGDILIKNGRLEKIGGTIQTAEASTEIDATDKFVLPGIIDDQVHFREPGLTHKAELKTESRAAVAGGVTSYMEMPNTNPPALTQELLEQKYQRASQVSLSNYSFFMGASNDNLEEVLKTNYKTVCGVKIFMGSSTGNMLVDDQKVLEELFAKVPMLIATHCEDEATIRANMAEYKIKYGDDVPVHLHPEIRSVEGCLKSSTLAVEMAKRHDTRLHILHISTADELDLFDNSIPLEEKRITSEVCVHHLFFNADDYALKGAGIKCNPAIKDKKHQEALLPALLDDRLDIIATDHAPHTAVEKANPYFKSPSGVPLIQHTLNIMLDFYEKGKISLEKIVEKMCHAPAQCFKVDKRGYLREGYWADVVIVNPEDYLTVNKGNLLYKCGWSPLEGHTFKGTIETTIVSGHLAYHQGQFNEEKMGQRLGFL